MTKTKILYVISIIVTVNLVACGYSNSIKKENEKYMKKYCYDLLSQTDKIEIQYFSYNDTISMILRDSNQIDILKEIINGKEENELVCDSTGKLLYFKGDTLLIEAYFSTPNTGSIHDKGIVSYYLKPDIYKTLITYRAGLIIDDYFSEVKSQNAEKTKKYR